jgi:solute carrier family 13 (sodium-dependent dicarboxylate transporter), member 2/3/5
MMDNDSRSSAKRWFKKIQHAWITNTSTFTGNFILTVMATYFFRQLNYGDEVDYVFFITILSIGLWVTEAIPPFAVGIFIIAMLLLGFGTDYVIDERTNVQMYIGTLTSNVIWLLLGGFFLAEGMRQAKLDRWLFKTTIRRFGSEPEQLLLGLMITSAVASMVMSNTATTAMMISSILPLARIAGKNSTFTTALMTGIPAAATVGGIGTIIGSTPNAMAIGALQEKGFQISFIQWMSFGVPVGLLLVYLFWRFLIRNGRLKSVQYELDAINTDNAPADTIKRRAVILTLLLTLGLWLTEAWHGIPVAATSAVPIVLLTLTQVIDSKEVRALPWDTLMLVAGGMALGMALVDVGLTKIAMDHILSYSIPPISLVFVFSVVAVLLSNVMSNTAASAILIPLGAALPYPFGIATPLIIAVSCSCALLLPVSTPSNAISYATGMVEQKAFRPGGLFLMTIGPFTAFIALLLWTWLMA